MTLSSGQARHDAVRGNRAHQQRVSLCSRFHDPVGSDSAAGARHVLDDHRFAEGRCEPVGNQARDDVRCAAGGDRDDRIHSRNRRAAREIITFPSVLLHLFDRNRGGSSGSASAALAKEVHQPLANVRR
jgi:hypothetical protein